MATAFRRNSDTEVVLHLFEEMGPECLTKLNGQFALPSGIPGPAASFWPGTGWANDRCSIRGTMEPSTSVRRSRRILNGAPIAAEIDPCIAARRVHVLVAVARTIDVSRHRRASSGPLHDGGAASRRASQRYWQTRFERGGALPTVGHWVREEAAAEELERLLVGLDQGSPAGRRSGRRLPERWPRFLDQLPRSFASRTPIELHGIFRRLQRLPASTSVTTRKTWPTGSASSIMCWKSRMPISAKPFPMRSGTWKCRRCALRQFRCTCCPGSCDEAGLKVVLTGRGRRRDLRGL